LYTAHPHYWKDRKAATATFGAWRHKELAATLMRMQNSYDIAQPRGRAGQIKVARFVRKVGDPSPARA
jgi:hypothetical protein